MGDLVVSGAWKSFRSVTALAGVDLTVAAGTVAAVLGPSGCGKTTLLRCIAGFERLDHGEIAVGGRTVAASSGRSGAGRRSPDRHLPPERRGVAVVPQEGALFPHLSVADNVAYGLDRAARRSGRVAEVLALVGLEGHGDRMPHQLSGGQQQRVAVARALAPRPRLVLLDEPFSALDAGLRGDLRRDVREALRADGATAVLVTHDQDEALSIADQIAVMHDGKIIQSGTPAEIYSAPVDAWVAGFVGEAVLLPAQINGDRARTALGELPVSPGAAGTATVVVRPEQVEVLPATADGGVPATVARRDFFGHDSLVALRLDDGVEVSARLFATNGGGLDLGQRVALRVRGPVLAYPAA